MSITYEEMIAADVFANLPCPPYQEPKMNPSPRLPQVINEDDLAALTSQGWELCGTPEKSLGCALDASELPLKTQDRWRLTSALRMTPEGAVEIQLFQGLELSVYL